MPAILLLTAALLQTILGDPAPIPSIAMGAERGVWEVNEGKQTAFRLNVIKPSASELRSFELLEVRLELDAPYDNPFDPEQIDVNAEFTSPSGKHITVPGFFSQDFVREDGERLRKSGGPYFAIRFTPVEVGTYRYRIRVSGRDKDGRREELESQWFTVKVLQNPQAKGFVRRGDFQRLRFDEGTPFVPVGLNVCWSGNNLSAYERWFSAMREHGANFARIWLVRWNMGLEWTPGDGNGMYQGIGRYALDNAWRIDELIRIAERNGIFLLLCLGYHGELSDRQLYFGEQAWDKNPYNRRNGGPCEKPADFWTNPEAKRFYKQRLRYIVARYAYSTNVLAFEFWNEVNAPAGWISEMAGFIRSIDPYGHLLTTTYGDDDVWRLPEMDLVQAHWYGDGSQRDCVRTIVNLHRQHLERYGKPFLLGEFGIDWRKSDSEYDPQGNALHWHNGMWASLASGGAGTACVWYWDSYIDRLKLWGHFLPVSEFVKLVGEGWERDWHPLQHTEPFAEEVEGPPFGDLIVLPSLGWQRPTGDEFILYRSGKVEGNGEMSTFLFSPSKPEMYRPPRFVVDFPEDGFMAMKIGTVSSGALLSVRIDGKEIWRQELPEGEEKREEDGRIYREGRYRERRWDATWRKWDYIYEMEFMVPIPKGKHVVEVDNRGADWCTVSHFRFSPYRDRRFPEVDIVGMQARDMALIWVHDQHSNFQEERGKGKGIRGLRFEVLGLRDGHYRIVWWDTWNGGIVKGWEAECGGGRLPLRIEELERDCALLVVPADRGCE
jgi:hypothetical protein